MKNQVYLRTVALMIAVALTLLLAGCGGVELTYRVSGTAAKADVAYTNADGETEGGTVSLPWEQTLSVGSDFSFELRAIDESASGTVTCEVLANGNTLGEGSGHSSVTCRGNFSKQGNSLRSSFSSVADPLAREHVQAGNDYLDQDQIDEAVAEYEKAVRLAPELAEAHRKLGFAYYQQGQFDEAVAELETATELDPNDADAQRNLGSAYLEQEKWEEATVAYEKAIDLEPDFGEAYGDLVWPYIELGKIEEAIATGEKAIELAPDYASAHNNLGVAYKEQGRLDEAIVEYEKAIAINPDHAGVHNNLGLVYARQGRLAEAIAEFQKAIEIESNHAGAHRNLGTTYLEQGELEKAAAAYEKAVELDPGLGKAYGDLAGVYAELGKLSEAIATGKKAIELVPKYALAHKNLGLAYYKQGEAEEAIAAFETYLQLRPDAPDRAAVEETIATLREEEAGTEYANVPGGYRLRYPEGWHYDERGSDVMFVEREEDLSVAITGAPVILFDAGTLGELADEIGVTEITDLAEVLRAGAEALGGEAGDVETGKIAGYPAALTDITGTYKGSPYEGSLALVVVDDWVIRVNGLGPPEQWRDVRPTFIEMINSLTFSAPEYSNAVGGYSLRYPEGWYITENETTTSLAPSQEDYVASTLQSPLFTLVTWRLAQAIESFGLAEGDPPAEYLQVMSERLEAETDQIESIQILGYPAAVAATTGTLEGSPYEGELIVILAEDTFFLAEGVAPPDQWADARPTFVDVINSLTFFTSEE